MGNIEDVAILRFQGPHRFLSNFWPCEVNGFPSVEHAYQAAKTERPDEIEVIRTALSPSAAKRLGQKVTMRLSWDSIKLDVMYDLVREKFTKHDLLRYQLLQTSIRPLYEGNWWKDTFWGVDDKTWKGENNLGKILMRVRQEIKEGQY